MIPVVELLAEVQRLGVKLVAEGDRLRFAPRHLLPAEIVNRLKEMKAEVIAALGANALATRGSGPTKGDELQVVKPCNASTNAVAIAEPKPYPNCGSAIFWLTASRTTTCPDCELIPADGARKLLIIIVDGQNRWADFETERKNVRRYN